MWRQCDIRIWSIDGIERLLDCLLQQNIVFLPPSRFTKKNLKTRKDHSFLKQYCERSSADVRFGNPLEYLVLNQLNQDCAQHCFKNEWMLNLEMLNPSRRLIQILWL